MGCNIHLYVEARGSNRTWESRDKWVRDATNPEQWDVDYNDQYGPDRNYSLFSILAGVRNNDVGGISGEPIVPVSEPRGLPDDVSELVRASSITWGCNGHSHSWLTLAELMAYNWTRTATLRGWVDAKIYAEWVRWGRRQGENPSLYCASVGWEGESRVTEQEMMDIIKKGDRDSDRLSSICCQVEWTQPYYRIAQRFLGLVIPRLWRLGSADDVRIVFWFDN